MTTKPAHKGQRNERTEMTDNLVRLGMALGVIVVITACLYQFGPRSAGAYEPLGGYQQKK